jgi:hypothetical protein
LDRKPAGNTAGGDQQRIEADRFAVFEGDLFRRDINIRRRLAKQCFNVVLRIKLFGTQRHPCRFGISLQIILAQIRAVVWNAVLRRDYRDTALESVFPQCLGRHVTGRTAAQNEKHPVVGRVSLRHGRRYPVGRVFGHMYEDLVIFDRHFEARQ